MLDKILQKMNECEYAPFREVKLWIMLSPFGGGKEKLLEETVAFHKKHYTIHQIRTEAIKSASYMYDDRRTKFIRQLERSPFLVIILDNNEERVRNILLPLIKYRVVQNKLTIILSEIERDLFKEQYSEIANIGLITQLSEENYLEARQKRVIKEYFS